MSRLDMYEKKVAARRSAILRSGKYKFIELMLLKSTRSRIQGIDVVRPIESEDIDNPGIPQYEFREGGGRIDFRFNEMKGGKFFEIVDTPKNRNFLASHEGESIWEITDPVIREEIKKMAKGVQRKVFSYKEEPQACEDDIDTTPDEAEGVKDDNPIEQKEPVLPKKRGPKRKGIAVIDDSAAS